MSTAAIPYYNLFIARGMNENDARENAEAVAALKSEEAKAAAAEVAKTVAEAEAAKAAASAVAKAGEQTKQTVADSEEKAKTQFVSRTEYHERDKTLATRDDIAEVNRRMDAGFAEANRRIDEVNRRMDEGFAQLRAEIAEIRRSNQNTNRIGIGLLFAIFALVAQLIIGG